MSTTNTETNEILSELHGDRNRFQRGKILFESNGVRKARQFDIDGTNWSLFKVKSNSRKDYEYEVIHRNNSDFYECNCHDFRLRKIICMHVYAVICKEVLVK